MSTESSFQTPSIDVPAQDLDRPVVLSGPSGAGKSTLIKQLMDEFPGKYRFGVSHTTRKSRKGEVDGVAYHFVDRQGFLDLVNKGGFIEYTESYGNLYGTSVMAVEDAMRLKESRCLLDVDSQGVINIKQRCSHLNPLYIFISPPSLEALSQRLGTRGSETVETMRARLSMARGEVEYAATGAYDAIVVNNDVDRAYAVLKDALTGRATGDSLPADILS
jgi:guanylate kinase